MNTFWLEADWPAPPGVRALTTLRGGGASVGAYASLNLGAHVGDDPTVVLENRRRLREALQLPSEPAWLQQVHGIAVAPAGEVTAAVVADAAFATAPGVVCAVLTADCLPLLLCTQSGSAVAAAHAGWRGLLAGVIEATVAILPTEPLMAWLGPAIGAQCFEVGDEVRGAFVAKSPLFGQGFTAIGNGKWLADIYLLARLTLAALGVNSVYGGGRCTFSEPEQFFSYRRDGVTGRMASLVWIADSE